MFVLRVEGLRPGLYACPLGTEDLERVRESVNEGGFLPFVDVATILFY